MLAATILVVFPFAMAYAAFSDLVSMTISNRVPAVLCVAFVLVALLAGMPGETILLHGAVGAVALCVTFGFFAAGWMGGGDAKLMAATALWFGPSAAMLDYLLVGAVFGGALTLLLLAARAQFLPATGVGFLDHLLEKETGIPYGIALGAAGLTVYSSSEWIRLAVEAAA